MNCPNCNAPIDQDTVFCGNCGRKLTPQYAQGATVAELTQQASYDERTPYPPRGNSLLPPTIGLNNAPQGNTPPHGYIPPQAYTPSEEQPYSPYLKGPAQAGLAPGQISPPLVAPPSVRRTTPRTVFLIGILVLLVIVASGALVTLLQNLGKSPAHTASNSPKPVAAALPAEATAFFSDSTGGGQGVTDTVKITASKLAAPPSGSQYNAWLIDVGNEKVALLGVLQASAPNYVLTYTNPQHLNLLSLGTELRVTQEQQGSTSLVGKTMLTASMPNGAFTHVRHLLYRFNTTPHNVGLLVGLHDQATLVFAQANSLKAANDQNNGTVVQCYAQSILDIVEGNHGPHAKPLDPACAAVNVTATGDGFGLLDMSGGGNGYIALAKAHAGLAAQAPDATETVKIHSGHVQICMANVSGWFKDIDGDALNILSNTNTGTQVKELVQRADYALNGVDLNNDESVDPVPGEGGATTAYIHGQLMAQLLLVAPK